MHNSLFENTKVEGGHVVLAIVSLITEGRFLSPATNSTNSLNKNNNDPTSPIIAKAKKFYEGPHVTHLDKYVQITNAHICEQNNILCQKYKDVENRILSLCEKEIPMCIEVLVTSGDFDDELSPITKTPNSHRNSVVFLAERWNIFFQNRFVDNHNQNMTANQLITAIRSQMYFSQLSAWMLSCDKENEEFFKDKTLKYRITLPGETYKVIKFAMSTDTHSFPGVHLDDNVQLNVSYSSIGRNNGFINLKTFFSLSDQQQQHPQQQLQLPFKYCDKSSKIDVLNFASISSSKLNRKLNFDLTDNKRQNCDNLNYCHLKPKCNGSNDENIINTVNIASNKSDITKDCDKTQCNNNNNENKSDICSQSTLDVYLRIALLQKRNPSVKVRQKILFDNDKYSCDITSNNSSSANNTKPITTITTSITNKISKSTDNTTCYSEVPSVLEQEKFRKSLDSAASMVFHSYIGLPLTSSPAPVRRGNSRFDFDSSLNSVSAIKSALFPLSNNNNNKKVKSETTINDEDSETDSNNVLSPNSPDSTTDILSIHEILNKKHGIDSSRPSNLLGSFEESVLNGRLEPVSTVHGFKAEICASGSFYPRHLVLPVTVFFYTVSDNDKSSSPYMGHINLGQKGYYIPKSGTIQVSLFNPLGTVVKMFVVMYDLSDMPPNYQTFIRQRTFYVPSNFHNDQSKLNYQWLRYLIHLRFMSSKSGRIYLHSDIRMIIFRKSDVDTATDHELNMSYELRSFIYSPKNPKYSPKLS